MYVHILYIYICIFILIYSCHGSNIQVLISQNWSTGRGHRFQYTFSSANLILGISSWTYTQNKNTCHMSAKYKSYMGFVSGELIRSKRKHVRYIYGNYITIFEHTNWYFIPPPGPSRSGPPSTYSIVATAYVNRCRTSKHVQHICLYRILIT